jgi:hypothetical protein
VKSWITVGIVDDVDADVSLEAVRRGGKESHGGKTRNQQTPWGLLSSFLNHWITASTRPMMTFTSLLVLEYNTVVNNTSIKRKDCTVLE